MGIKADEKVAVRDVNKMDVKKFNTNYLRKNKPLVVKSMAGQWAATDWTLEKIAEKAGDTSILFSQLMKKEKDAEWSLAK